MIIPKNVMEKLQKIRNKRYYYYNINKDGMLTKNNYYDENTFVLEKDLGDRIEISKVIGLHKDFIVKKEITEENNSDKDLINAVKETLKEEKELDIKTDIEIILDESNTEIIRLI